MRYLVTAVGVLAMAGLTPALAQFPPPPGQQQQQSQSPFPPAPGQQPQSASPFPPPPNQEQQSASPFPAPSGQGMAPLQGGFVRPSQGGFSAPSQGGGFSGRPPQSEPSDAQRICLNFPSIREEVEKGAATIREASERKASREEVCPLFKSFAVKEAKLVKFLETNQRLCGVPPNIVQQVKGNHAQTIKIRNNVCSAAPAARGPTLSDALGGPTIADDTSARQPGRGTFDTLTGNALRR